MTLPRRVLRSSNDSISKSRRAIFEERATSSSLIKSSYRPNPKSSIKAPNKAASTTVITLRMMSPSKRVVRRRGAIPAEGMEGARQDAAEIDEKFDLIVSKPPFVISPRSGLTVQNAGLEGDGVSELAVRESPAHLTDGGCRGSRRGLRDRHGRRSAFLPWFPAPDR
jgi:hypothetical protein